MLVWPDGIFISDIVWPCQSQVEEPSRNPNTLPSITVFPIQLIPTVLPIFWTKKIPKPTN